MGWKNIISKEEFRNNIEIYALKIKKGIFIVPTDTIYGLSCNATNSKLVRKLRKIKKQVDRPLSVIVPSKEWIRNNCEVSEEAEKYLKKLPGAYTLILPLKTNSVIAEEVSLGTKTLGVRIPNHWISEMSKFMNIPLITTSANVTGTNFMTCIEDLDDYLRKRVDFVIDQGDLKGRPSNLVHLEKDNKKIIKR